MSRCSPFLLCAVADLVQRLLLVLFDTVGNTFLILLLVLYLLFEQSSHPVGTLRRTSKRWCLTVLPVLFARGHAWFPCDCRAGKIDDQIQRYIGIKTLISAAVGFLVYLVLGVVLDVKLAHLFGILTFFMNFIPNVGPVIATGTSTDKWLCHWWSPPPLCCGRACVAAWLRGCMSVCLTCVACRWNCMVAWLQGCRCA